MQRVIILGAGGHAQVVADMLLQMARHGAGIEPLGYLDDNPALHDRRLLGLPVLGSLADLPSIAHEALIVAIGGNQTRRRLFLELAEQGEHFISAVHPRAIIAADVLPGPGCMICAGAVVNPGSSIGANVILNTGCSVDHHNRIADHVHIAPGAHLGGDVTIEEGALIGIGATVMPQRRVGAWSVVGAAGLVQRDLPEQVVAVGVPARIIRRSK